MLLQYQVRNLILGILALLPVASIATAAESALSEREGQVRSDRLRAELFRARRILFPEGNRRVSIVDAYERVRALLTRGKSPSPATVDEEMQRLVLLLLDNGMIQMDEKQITSLVERRRQGRPLSW